jgi:hypothetical protein
MSQRVLAEVPGKGGTVKILQTLLIGALVGAVLAVLGLAGLDRTLNPSADEVAKRQANQVGYDPKAPPPFYGNR